MAGLSYRTKLIGIITGLVFLSLLVVIVAIVWSTERSIEQNVQRELDVSERVLAQLLDIRNQQLQQSARVLADDFGFREAVSSGDQATIVSALINHGDRINADLMVLLDPSGEVVVSSHDIDDPQTLLDIPDNSRNHGLFSSGENIYQLVVIPVRAPHLISWVVMGFAVDQALLAELHDLLNSQIAFYAINENQGMVSVASFPELVPEQNSIEPGTMDGYWESKLSELNFTGRWINSGEDQRDSSGMLWILLAADREQTSAPFRALGQQLLVISLITLLCALLSGLILSRQISYPLRQMVYAARRMAGGDYSESVTVKNRDEFGELAGTFNTMQKAISEREQRITYQSTHDELTDLPNERMLRSEIKSRISQNRPFTVCELNLDNYSQLNDMFGQAICDQVLKQVATRIKSLIPEHFWLARGTREEFILIASGIAEHNESAVRSIIKRLSNAVDVNHVYYQVNFSAGLSDYPETGDSGDALVRRAQFARHKARSSGQPLSIYQLGEDESHMRKLSVSAALRNAIEHKSGFHLVFQPQISASTGELLSAEALLRWQDDELGMVSPVEFIPLAEQSGEIRQLTRWVLYQSVSTLAKLREQGIDFNISINLSASDLLDESLAGYILSILGDFDVPAARLTVEVTESAVIMSPELAKKQLTQLRSAGLDVAIDDYGTGYSSLAQLSQLPATELKIDRCFVMPMAEDESARTIVASTIALAHQLNLSVVAEGVEDTESLQMLMKLGCDVLQGYYISRPLELKAFITWVENHQPEEFK